MEKMKKHFRSTALIFLTVIVVLFGLGLAAGATTTDPTGLLPLSLLPFAFGAIKVRSAMTQVRTITYAHASATVADTIYLINGKPMLAVNSAGAGEANVFVLVGVIEYAKLSAQAWTGGEAVYWDDANSRFTTVSTDNTIAGYAAEPAVNPSATGFVLLWPTV
jgi:predicted RecA/RadA family phage recombinase